MEKLIAITAAFSSYLLTASSAFAQSVQTCAQPPFDLLCNLTGSNFGGIIGAAITLLFVIAVVIALGFLIFGGIKWILSGGDKTAVENARDTIVAAIVGLVIVFLSYFILNIVLKFFNIDIGNLQLPNVPKA